MSSSTVFITVPKYVTITSAGTTANANANAAKQLPKLKPALATTTTTTTKLCALSPMSVDYDSSSSSSNNNINMEYITPVPRGKKRRLDHLTWEEKVQRKKLKNRVAAQTSRDRKKAHMEEMETEIKDLSEKTEILQNKCDSLQVINDALLEKNRKLDTEVELLRQQLTDVQEKQKQHEIYNKNIISKDVTTKTTVTCAGCESIINGSAVSNNTDDPLQQGSFQMMMNPQSTQEKNVTTTTTATEKQLKKCNMIATLWRIVALCLLYKKCSSSTQMKKNSMPINLKNWPKVYSQISQQTWRQAIQRAMKLLPKLQAVESDCLDQWWGPQQSAWNPANIAQEVAAA